MVTRHDINGAGGGTVLGLYRGDPIERSENKPSSDDMRVNALLEMLDKQNETIAKLEADLQQHSDLRRTALERVVDLERRLVDQTKAASKAVAEVARLTGVMPPIPGLSYVFDISGRCRKCGISEVGAMRERRDCYGEKIKAAAAHCGPIFYGDYRLGQD